jgi:hypothetical protein
MICEGERKGRERERKYGFSQELLFYSVLCCSFQQKIFLSLLFSDICRVNKIIYIQSMFSFECNAMG